MKLVSYSREDVAGANIAGQLRDGFGFEESDELLWGRPVHRRGDVVLAGRPTSLLYLEDSPELAPELMVVASRHRSESGTPTLTVHATGNFGPADFGGSPQSLSIAPALYLRQALAFLRDNVGGMPYKVSLEVTHHGPTSLSFPLLFVEVGSGLEQWRDESACRLAAEAINHILSEPVEDKPSAIGFGGPHYAPNFSETADNVAFGHIAPKHAMDSVDKEMVEQMIERTVPSPDFAVLDWKGLRGGERRALAGVLEEVGLPWRRSSEMK